MGDGMSEALSALIEHLRGDLTLDRPERLRERVDALDRIERLSLYLSDTPDTLALSADIAAQQSRLDAVNERLYRNLRDAIRRGDGANCLREWVPVAEHADTDTSIAQGEGYDHLDALLGGIAQLHEPADDVAALAPEMVFYQPTPARHIFDLIRRIAPGADDVVLDVGSGLGHVPLLVGACTSARCIGVELEPAYVASARAAAADLRLSRVSFIQADARAADLSQATVFYLYTPFTGGVLGEMLERIREQAQRRDIRLCSLGPCTQVLAAQRWLRAIDVELHSDRIAVFVPCGNDDPAF
jgi:hypothetical protein